MTPQTSEWAIKALHIAHILNQQCGIVQSLKDLLIKVTPEKIKLESVEFNMIISEVKKLINKDNI